MAEEKQVQEVAQNKNIEDTSFQLNGQSSEIGELAKALAKFQTELAPAHPSEKNSFFNSTYATIGDCLKACQSLLGSNGIALNQGSEICRKTGVFQVWTQLTHSSGQWIRGSVPSIIGAKKNNHEMGSAVTYGRRYGLSMLVGISQFDDDGNATVNQGDIAPHKRKAGSV